MFQRVTIVLVQQTKRNGAQRSILEMPAVDALMWAERAARRTANVESIEVRAGGDSWFFNAHSLTTLAGV